MTEVAARTRLMARIVGPFLVILGATMVLRVKTPPLLMPAFSNDAPLVLLTGLVALGIGLSMVAVHNHWNTVPAMAISLLGWFTALRGAIILLSPDVIEQAWGRLSTATPVFVIAGIVLVLAGSYLTFVGWIAKDVQPVLGA